MNKLVMVDLSSNNDIVDLESLWAHGVRVLTLKATEGTTYAWEDAVKHARTWHKMGGICGHYHFMHPGGKTEGVNEAKFFVEHLHDVWGVGDFPVVDHETKGESNAEVGAFIDLVHQHYPHVEGLQYAYRSFFEEAKLTRHQNWGLWVAAYGGKTAGKIPASWATWDAWQYTSTGTAPGVRGSVDLSHIRRWLVQPGLHYGQSSWAVVDLKTRLHKLGYRGMIVSSPRYGSGAVNAVLKFKKDHRHIFGANPSGKVAGRRFWATLDRLVP